MARGNLFSRRQRQRRIFQYRRVKVPIYSLRLPRSPLKGVPPNFQQLQFFAIPADLSILREGGGAVFHLKQEHEEANWCSNLHNPIWKDEVFPSFFCGILFTAVSWYCLLEVSVISRECIHVVFLFRSRRTSWFSWEDPVSSSGSGRVFPTLCASTLRMNTCISGCFDGRAMLGGITIFPTWNIHVLLFSVWAFILGLLLFLVHFLAFGSIYFFYHARYVSLLSVQKELVLVNPPFFTFLRFCCSILVGMGS